MKAILLQRALAALTVIASSNSAFAALYSIAPSSSLTFSGNVNVEISVAIPNAPTITGSGSLVEQGPGSLNATLSGSINANANGAVLSFPGGSSIVAAPSGNWDPQKVPAAFGFLLAVPLSAPGVGSVGTLRLIGDLRDLAFDVSGDAALTGTTFNPQGLALATKSGSIDMHGFFCGGTETDLTKCDDLGTNTSLVDDGGGPDLLPSGAGSFDGKNLSLALALAAPGDETQNGTVNIDGVDVAVTSRLTGTFNLAGNVLAAAIPEPSVWLALALGMLGFVAVARSRGLRPQ